MAPWWSYPVTQAHGVNAETGVDLGTPFHTPLTALLPGVVQQVLCDVGWRCEVDIATSWQGQPAVEAFEHVDVPLVRPGQSVAVGQEIGLSGGQLAGGANPDSPAYSSGPHTEFNVFLGTQPWRNPIDPTAFVKSAGTGGGGPSGPLPGGALNPVNDAAWVASQVAQGLQQGLVGAVTTAGHGLADAAVAGLQDVGIWLSNHLVPFLVAVVVVMVLFGLR
jgi:hypothetical protein